ncbi:MAG: response regulator [Candidatus Lokiarchaeota archaeon]|nr:response regulator [Candidatus Lokiarchaeota archaeon]
MFTFELTLQFHHFQILGKAVDGEEAIQKFASFSEKPDVIVIDHRVPKKNGIEIMNEILKIDNFAKIIFVSADFSVKEEALLKGAFSFLIKPITQEELLFEINNALENA